jgi:hypothetical protein
LILSLRLLIARAGNQDSLAWWDDQSFTTPAGFILERTFPVAPRMAARSLALAAAFDRHEAACLNDRRALHLFRLDPDNQDRLALRFERWDDVPVPDEPIVSMDQLRQRLQDALGDPMPGKATRQDQAGALLLAIPPCPPDQDAMLHRAKTLAWAYLAGAPGQPVFPYCLEPTP